MTRGAQSDRLLVYGFDPVLLGTRLSILKMAGYTVCEVTGPRNLTETLASSAEPCGLLVVCHSVPVEERQRLAAVAAERRLPLFQLERLIAPVNLLAEVSRLINHF